MTRFSGVRGDSPGSSGPAGPRGPRRDGADGTGGAADTGGGGINGGSGGPGGRGGPGDAGGPRDAGLAELDRVVGELVERPGVSGARARQLRWVAGEIRRASGHREFPAGAGASLAALLDSPAVTAYLALARRGELRTRVVPDPARVSDASMRVRADCLELVAGAAGLPPPPAQRPVAPDPRPVVPSRQRSLLRRHLADQAGHRDADAGRVRLLALVGVVLDTGARAGELCALRVDDLADDLTTVRIVRRPQARSVSPPVTEVLPLSAPSRAALRHWLPAREELVAGLQGAKTALWVSVRSNHAGVLDEDGRASRRPAGMPLMPRGLARAYTRAVVRLNAEMAGRAGWEPLPYRLEQLRRAVLQDPRTSPP
ncbi:hypothetical protein AQ490_15485 [Wenjunlia vitaminophila]|uniref:Tyr recombinase domain-containing protein n=1 Tax=Wenjunlia vitaminophila TaxID=76728 RepID=A0A0T6LXB6_WENVI|nr:hypothetical protein AQ490_15485 [Wenjunlia vitaminophila]